MAIDWIAVIQGLVTLVGLAIAWDARKTAREKIAAAAVQSADAGESASNAVKVLLDPLVARIKALEGQVETLTNREMILVREREEREERHAIEISEVRRQMTDELAAVEARRQAEAKQAEIQRLKMEADLAVLRAENATLKARVAELETKVAAKPPEGT